MAQEEERTTRLEEEVAHLSMVNEELSAEIATQWKRIDLLEKKIAKFENRFLAMEEAMDNPIENTKPPHW